MKKARWPLGQALDIRQRLPDHKTVEEYDDGYQPFIEGLLGPTLPTEAAQEDHSMVQRVGNF